MTQSGTYEPGGSAAVLREWGVEVWPGTDSPWNRVDQYASCEQAESLLRTAYGSETRLVCRDQGGTWRPFDSGRYGAGVSMVADRGGPRCLT